MTRKLIGLCFAIPLMAIGSYGVYLQLAGHYVMHGRFQWLSPILIVAGLVWVASDWFDL